MEAWSPVFTGVQIIVSFIRIITNHDTNAVLAVVITCYALRKKIYNYPDTPIRLLAFSVLRKDPSAGRS